MTVELRLDVHDIANSTSPIGTLTEAYGRAMLPDLHGRGGMSFAVDIATTADVALLEPRRVVRWHVRYDGGSWIEMEAFLIDDRPTVLASGDERPAMAVTGQGLLGWLGYDRGGAVLSAYKHIYGLQANPRPFAWYAFDYLLGAGWGAPTSLGTYADPTDPQLKGGEGDPGTNEVQKVVLDAESPPYPWGSDYPSPGGLTGTWRLTFRGKNTSPIQWDATASAVKTALEGAGASIGSVTGSGTSGSPFVITWDDLKQHPVMGILHDDLRHNHGTTKVTRVTAGSKSVEGEGLVPGWPDTKSHWYGNFGVDQYYRFSRDLEAEPQKVGEAVIFVVTAGSAITVWTDGREAGTAGKLDVLKLSHEFEETEHLIAVETDGPFMMVIANVDDEGKLVNVLWRTGSAGWSVFGPDKPPGVTPGFVVKRAVDESRARGELPALDGYDFDNADDSGGVAWARTLTHAFRWQTLGRLVDDLAGLTPVEAQMTPAGLLRLFQRRGQDRSATVTVQLPFGAQVSRDGPRVTRGLVETPGGAGEFGPSNEATYGVMADLLTFGSGLGPDELVAAVQDHLARFSAERSEVDLDLPDDVKPYDDVFLGDTVTVDVGDIDAPYRLTSFMLADDTTTGQPEWSATGTPDA